MNPRTPRPVLSGRKALVVGVANEYSIAWGCARAFHELGAQVAITYLNDKARPHVGPLARSVGAPLLLPLDVIVPGQLEAAFDTIARQWGTLDILVHSIAFAPKQDLQGVGYSTARPRASPRRWTCPATRSCAWRALPRR
jgi:enoyl-[acyl-carrier protein] reductase I